MDRDTSYRARIGTKIDISELGISKEVYDKKNKEKSWGYHEHTQYNINFIVISKNGTLGDIYLVDNLYIGLPSIEGQEILNDGIEGYEAVWHRNKERPTDFEELWFDYKSKMAKHKAPTKRQIIRNEFVAKRNKLNETHKKFIDKEFDKREYGHFVKIDNEVHYITGENWMFLEHYYLTENDMYPKFRLAQTEAYWHWEACVADTRCWGEMRGKGRRTSWSVESASMALNRLTIVKYAEIPIVSERKDLAEKLFQNKVVKSFEYYPIYFKPLIELPDDEAKRTLSIRHETKRKESGSISFYPTKATAYDSTKVKDLSINDEIGKWEDTSLIEFISRHSKCHTNGNGKGRFGSTAGEYHKGGGAEFETEFKSADPLQRNQITGRTTNGLINFFIDICYTMTEPMVFFDEWGYSIVNNPIEPILNEEGKIIEVGAIAFWDATHKTLKKNGEKQQLNGFLRDAPRDISMMFRREGGVVNSFDIENLNNHLDFLAQYPESELNEKIIFRGNLRWKGEPYTSDVMWVANPKGRFKTTWIPETEMQNKFSKKTFHGKEMNMPDNSHISCAGIDSYDLIGNTGDGKGSDGAIVSYSKYNMVGAPTHSFYLIYKERPDKREDFYDDCIMACRFWGFFANIESNKGRILEHFYEKGYTGYVLRRPDKKYKDMTDQEQKYGGQPSSTPVIEDETDLLKSYIVDHIGNNLETDCKVWHKELVAEWVEFNPAKRQPFDLSVASGKAIMGAQYQVKQRKVFKGLIKSGVSFSAFGA
jgi:hypothetical protein